MDPSTLPGKVVRFVEDSEENQLSLGSLAAYRDFVDAREMASAAVLALSKLPTASGEVVNIGSGDARTARDLVLGMLQFSTHRVTVQEGVEGSSRSETVGWQEMDATKARETLGWTVTIPWLRTLRYTVRGEV